MSVTSKSKMKWVTAAVILVVVVVALSLWRTGGSLDIAYKEVKPARGNLEVTILSTGTVSPENRLEIKPPIAGRVESVLIVEGQSVRKGQILAWMSSTERAALLDAARARGPEELQKWEDLYKATPILAPINGTIILRNVEPGQTFTATDSPFVMSDRLTIKAQVDETDIADVKLKQAAEVVLDAYPKKSVPAHVDQIAFDAKTVNNVTTYVVDVLPDQTPSFMRSGMTANVKFYIAAKRDALILPSEAIKAQDGYFYVLTVAGSDQKNPTKKAVELGITDGKRTEIVSGLTENDTVLVAQIKQGKTQSGGSPFSPMGSRRGGGH